MNKQTMMNNVTTLYTRVHMTHHFNVVPTSFLNGGEGGGVTATITAATATTTTTSSSVAY